MYPVLLSMEGLFFKRLLLNQWFEKSQKTRLYDHLVERRTIAVSNIVCFPPPPLFTLAPPLIYSEVAAYLLSVDSPSYLLWIPSFFYFEVPLIHSRVPSFSLWVPSYSLWVPPLFTLGSPLIHSRVLPYSLWGSSFFTLGSPLIYSRVLPLFTLGFFLILSGISPYSLWGPPYSLWNPLLFTLGSPLIHFIYSRVPLIYSGVPSFLLWGPPYSLWSPLLFTLGSPLFTLGSPLFYFGVPLIHSGVPSYSLWVPPLLSYSLIIKTITRRAHVSRFVYDFKKADFEGLRQSLSAIQLDMGFDEDDIDQSWESWRNLFLNAVKSFIPKIKLKDAKSPKWIDSGIIKLSKQKYHLWKRAKQSNSPILWDNYRAKGKQIKTATKRKYHDFLMNMQTNLKDDPKKFYGQKLNLQGFLKWSVSVIRRLLHLLPRLTYSIAFLPLYFRSPICIQQQVCKRLQIMSFT